MAGEAKTPTVDFEALKSKSNLSEEDNLNIGLMAIAEAEAEEKAQKEFEEGKEPDPEAGKEEKAKEEAPAAGEGPAKETPEPTEEEKAKAEEKRLLEAKEEDLSAEDKTKRVDLVKKQDEEKAKAFEVKVQEYAQKNEMTVDEAKVELESIGKIREKYTDDPEQLAKANLHIQRLYTKEQEKAKALEESASRRAPSDLTDDNIIKDIDNGIYKVGGEKATREGVIAAYREANADDVANLDDAAVLKLIARDIRHGIELQRRDDMEKLAQGAKEKKEKLISGLSEADKQYLPEIKPILDRLPAAHIMHESFSLMSYIRFAKGGKFDQAVKDAEERGYKRGMEQAKILGDKNAPGASGKPPAPKKPEADRLTPDQKKRAMDMYGEVMVEEQAYEAYLDYLKDDKK